MKFIDLSTWERAPYYHALKKDNPHLTITFELDISRFLPRVHERGLSFTRAFVYLVSTCANGIEAYRYRFVEGKVALYERIENVLYTYMKKGSQLFQVVNVLLTGTVEEFVKRAAALEAEQTTAFPPPVGPDRFRFPIVPWISYTQAIVTAEGENDAPLFIWGKYHEREGKTLLPFPIGAHHVFVDGVHLGQLAEALQQALDAF